MKEINVICDICKTKTNSYHSDLELQVIFLTDQTGSGSTEPYLYNVVIDICLDCKDKILKGNYVFAAVAYGCKNFFFRKQNNEF